MLAEEVRHDRELPHFKTRSVRPKTSSFNPRRKASVHYISKPKTIFQQVDEQQEKRQATAA